MLHVSRMAELGLDPAERVLCFAQLLGMCDQMTFPLGWLIFYITKINKYDSSEVGPQIGTFV